MMQYIDRAIRRIERSFVKGVNGNKYEKGTFDFRNAYIIIIYHSL